ncbi:hypothetical protein LOTGIDRAFT_165220 [Lottia gigantea]|uniref:Inositol-pentakisphosphate 2-kinase n=1 Tax=Lottia gigantea TaxID=225164 RepID=V4BJ58_LOTGI|nr:hypothetical protein LOTGIDRAFT_165220 [Lottia gigantea]ESO88804.1 hypothetical protein LOTGIDRAFT_165220 [Lottia gigantea]
MALPMECNLDWQYRGEGNCSLAVANSEEKKVFRFVKNYFTQQLEAISSKSLESRNQSIDVIEEELKKVIDYVKNVMQPLLSKKFVQIPVLCKVKDGIPKEAELMVTPSRPGHRRCKSQDNVDTSARTALVLPDLCFLPGNIMSPCTSSNISDTPTISIEIKPKKGFLPTSDDIDNTSLRHQVCKYCMHQRLKTKEGKWQRTTNYCPLDLFSGNKQRMKHALLGLIHTPQNNLKICKNGTEVYGAHIQSDLTKLFQDFFSNDRNNKCMYAGNFIDLVIYILLMPQLKGNNSHDTSLDPSQSQSQVCYNSKYVEKSCNAERESMLPADSVLEKIHSLQSLDEFDIELIYPIYKTLQSHLNIYPQHRVDWGLDGPYTSDWLTESIHSEDSQHLQSAVIRIKKFLISKTVQDCSIMIAIKPLNKRPSDSMSVINYHEQYFHYSISIIDLDPKRFDKIPTYFTMEQEMEEAYQENLDKRKLHEKSNGCDQGRS